MLSSTPWWSVGAVANASCRPGVPAAERQPLTDVTTAPSLADTFKGVASYLSAFPDTSESYTQGIEEGENIDARAVKLESDIRSLENLVDGFKVKVDDIVEQFEGLREVLGRYSLSFDALETDHIRALAALQEEKETVVAYRGNLANAEIELSILRDKLPADEAAIGGFSQARPGSY